MSNLHFTEAEKALITKAFKVIQQKAWQNSEDHGFHGTDRPFSEEVALFHSEVSEMLEEWRAGREFDEIHYTAKETIYNDPDRAVPIKVQVPAPEFNEDGTRNKPEGIGPEGADILIRLFESAEQHGIPLDESLFAKHEFNVSRPFMHGKKA